jgi:hypothetical protein
MARGWESKAVEAQQNEAQRGAAKDGPGEDPERARHRRTLELSRARATADLQSATRPAHQQMLRHAIAALDAQIAALDGR